MGRRLIRPARMMLIFAVAWYAMLLVFAQMPDAVHGRAVLLPAGLAQSLSLVPMAVMLLHGAGERFRGWVMGLRMLAVYGLPLGLMGAGALIDRLGFAMATSLPCSTGLGRRWLLRCTGGPICGRARCLPMRAEGYVLLRPLPPNPLPQGDHKGRGRPSLLSDSTVWSR